MALATPARARRDPQTAAAVLLAAVLLATFGLNLVNDALSTRPTVQLWTTMFVAVCVQAMPFLVLGVTVGGLVEALVPDGLIQRLLPRSAALSVPTAALAGVVLPGCECSSVPVAGRLVGRGAPAPAALAFLLAAPAINPVVLVATSVAFPGRPEMVLARFVASVGAAVVVGWLWARFASDALTARALRRSAAMGDGAGGHAHADHGHGHDHAGHEHGHDHDHDTTGGGRLSRFFAAAQHDLLHAGGFLVFGAALAASLHTFVPRRVLDRVADHGLLAIVALAALAVLLAVCSEADAFIAASLPQFSLTSRLVFLVVGPMVDIKLVALQAGTFGRRFAVRFAPLTLVVATLSAVATASWLL